MAEPRRAKSALRVNGGSRGEINLALLFDFDLCFAFSHFLSLLVGWNGMPHSSPVTADRTRQCWADREERYLLATLKELVSHGWKSDNGFRGGYLFKLEEAMRREFPTCGLRANPHIQSKIHTWKKNYGAVAQLLALIFCWLIEGRGKFVSPLVLIAKDQSKRRHMEFESSSWIKDGVCFYPHLFGGIMITCALLSFSTSYFGMIGVPPMPHLFPDLRVFHKKKSTKKHVRVYIDGCFDLMHYGHANALRQAKALGDELVVGVVSDEEIIANKGPPVMSMEERLALVSGLKWVDEVIPNAPYEITEEFIHRLFKDHKIDYIIHGDDPCLLPDGTDAYALAKKAGRY
ncbi:hypothetical protein SASPL_126969 [Salvia splendens]|uniref:ethanolamine-phosphate cytidylyltransferase n=1 Tax=Salvia splendens TaxID=180675 RepID=A0A8X8ZRN0_SALSN|nr:hypothetical protein SASPL_126969 [Salvia splendens]